MWMCSKCGGFVSEEFSEFVKNLNDDCYNVVCRDCFIDDQVTKFKKED